MNREEALRMSRILEAYAEGKVLQWLDEDSNWEDCDPEKEIEFLDFDRYRVKPDINVRPYRTKDEFIMDLWFHGPNLLDRRGDWYGHPSWDDDNTNHIIVNGKVMSWDVLFEMCVWQDGHMCGKVNFD